MDNNVLTDDPAVAFASGKFSEGSVVLSAGSHSLTVQSDVATGSAPAGFYTKLDSVPDGGSLAGLYKLF